MKRLLFLFLIITGCSLTNEEMRSSISLAGEWKFRVDSLDEGIDKQWYNQSFEETVSLPGSMAENGKGNGVTLNTPWTGDIIDRSYFTDEKYEKYRQKGNIKIPFWLKPVRYYKGVAWYQKEIEIPENWEGTRVNLFLERCHWESTAYVNGKPAGTCNSLATPHEYDITELITSGKNRISIRIDNRIIIPVGMNSHSISDHTQGNWNGITGEIKLVVTPRVFIDDIKVFPDIEKKVAKVIISIKNPERENFTGDLRIRTRTVGSDKEKKFPVKKISVSTNSDQQQVILNYKILKPELWSEFNPVIYKLSASLKGSDKKTNDFMSVDFGMREFKVNGTRFQVNGIPVFLRGTTECCIFPLTGYPPSDPGSWEKVLKTCRDYGLNHVRFHSYCPPEAAFRAADKLGIYFHIECSSWANQGASIGNGENIDRFIYEESDRILEEYGNHPSFCMLAYGNEPAGRNQNKYLGELINYWKAKDTRRVYTSAAGWPVIPENDYNLIPAPRIQQWGQGLKSIINGEPPQTMFDFSEAIKNYNVPVVGHEIGQWCVYPDFKEIEKYTGTLKPTNFEIFRETLEKNNMGGQAEDFLMASGKLQTLCYKADIEAALRTPGYAGFEMLQLHDFPGQGTALVGILNPFFESKGYITPEEFRMFCNETVPLARMEKIILRDGDTFEARVEITHFGRTPLRNVKIPCRVTDNNGKILREETMIMEELVIGNNIVGLFTMDIGGFSEAQKLKFEVSLAGTGFRNQWDLWVYPESGKTDPEKIYITDNLDKKSEDILKDGESVLLLTFGKVGQNKGAGVAIGFSSIFWNTAWTNNQPPHTLGILCDPEHPLFDGFPTEYHSNWQWWDPVTHSQAMILDGFPEELKPLIQPIDTWFENRRLALAFESKTGGGKLLVCSIDLTDISEERVVSKQLLSSVIEYMKSGNFNPDVDLNLRKIEELLR
ncbi:MAG TPA: glycoside hydrolase family 2 TIM barrel-domain containing protein [Bacteroidales bacterium]|nr:glycoside hydrolase family 2 TIM barrel-domain containing protein [Bacteroidales bacterium]HQM68447.1 glycoside hydrolase family 2 TIM barrel-domain containing protein [Bacteroidales bacterium]